MDDPASPTPSCHDDRPRERMRAVGVRNLSVKELLTVLVGSGGAGGSAAAVADRVLARTGGSLRALASLDPGGLERLSGVGPATASRVAAALELGRRTAAAPADADVVIRGPADVHAAMAPRLRDLPHEEFHVLLLNTRHRVVRTALVTRGILDASLIHPREVFRPAVLEGAAAVIVVHNHPSGDPTPSAEDRAVTRQLAEAGRALGIPLLDHVVVGDGRWCSVDVPT